MTEDHTAEFDALVAQAVAAGLMIETAEDGQPTLTPLGAQVARNLAMGGDDADAVLDALLEAVEKRPT